MHALCAPTTLLHKSRISGHLLFLSFCISSSYRWSPGTYSIILVLVHQRIYIHWERTAPHPVVLNWDSFLCSVCCMLRYMSVCLTADIAGGGGGVLSVLRGYIHYTVFFVVHCHRAHRETLPGQPNSNPSFLSQPSVWCATSEPPHFHKSQQVSTWNHNWYCKWLWICIVQYCTTSCWKINFFSSIQRIRGRKTRIKIFWHCPCLPTTLGSSSRNMVENITVDILAEKSRFSVSRLA